MGLAFLSKKSCGKPRSFPAGERQAAVQAWISIRTPQNPPRQPAISSTEESKEASASLVHAQGYTSSGRAASLCRAAAPRATGSAGSVLHCTLPGAQGSKGWGVRMLGTHPAPTQPILSRETPVNPHQGQESSGERNRRSARNQTAGRKPG